MSVRTTTNGVAPTAFRSLTPSDSIVTGAIAAIRVTGAGNLVLRGPSDPADVTIPVAANETFPCGAGVLVKAATTATGLFTLG